MSLVVDNSVVIAWLIGTQATDYSRAVWRRARRESLYAPAVWPFELVNALWMMHRRRLLNQAQVQGIIANARRLEISVDREPVSMATLFDLAQRAAVSAYDAAYVDLALRRGWPLATKDDRLREAARAAGVALA